MANGVGAQDIYDYVKNGISTRKLFPGNRIVEEDLATELNTSRTTVRTAITRLSYDGYLEVIPKKGTFVAKPTFVDMTHVYDMRKLLECEAVHRAMRRIDEAGLQRMEDCLKRQEQLEANFTMLEYIKINRDFHYEIIKAADNDYLEKFLSELFNKTAIFLTFYDKSTSNVESLNTHRCIYEAIKGGNEEAAIDAIRKDNQVAKSWIEI